MRKKCQLKNILDNDKYSPISLSQLSRAGFKKKGDAVRHI